MPLLSVPVLLQLASDPQCGGAVDSKLASVLAGIASKESGGDPLAIGVNRDPVRGLPHETVRSATAEEATTRARALIAQGRSIDLGLMGINMSQLSRHHLTIDAAFLPCASMRAGSEHYKADLEYVINLGLRRYNTGGVTGGQGYAAAVLQAVSLAQNAPADASRMPPVLAAFTSPEDPNAPPAWDVWARQEWEEAKAKAAVQPPTPPQTASVTMTEVTAGESHE